jgi:hypothetical protein
LRAEVARYRMEGRTESAAFLMWYLRNFFRLEELETIFSVCDSANDKGIDGLYVDEEEEEVHLFQSKYSPDFARDQGDNDLRNFMGAKTWFTNANSVQSLLSSTASEELKGLVQASDVFDKIKAGYPVFSHFVTNKVFNRDAKEFLGVNEGSIIGHDLPSLLREYTFFAEPLFVRGPTPLHLNNQTVLVHNLPAGISTRVYSIPALEIVKLEGIQDLTLFYRNVRYGLGRTRVNRDITKTIEDTSQHDKFFLYHNGLTLVADGVTQASDTLTLRNYSIINGCQSVLTMYENRTKLSPSMEVLVKVIQLDQSSPLVADITKNTNNQNPIRIQDLKGDDRVHKALQTEFRQLFGTRVLYQRKRGEPETGYTDIIDLDLAAQLLESFYLGNPQNTHLKARLFGDRYGDIFSRNTNAAKIYLAFLVYQVIVQRANALRFVPVRDYGLAHFFFVHLVAEILGSDSLGKIIVSNPTDYVRDHPDKIKEAVANLWSLMVQDVDAYIDEYAAAHGNFFDYKNVFKRSDFVTTATARLLVDHRKSLVRHPEDSFESIYNSLTP